MVDPRRSRQARRLGRSGWLTMYPGWCWVCGAVVGRRFSATLCRLSVPVAGSLTCGSMWQCRLRLEQTGHDAGLHPALSGLSIRPLSARHHPVACQATTRVAACPYRSDSQHFVAVCPVLLQVASRASLVFPSGREAPMGLCARCVKCGSRRLQQMTAHVYVCLLYIIMRVTVSTSIWSKEGTFLITI